jgi:hypothetical protein
METLEFAQLRFHMIAGPSTDAAEVEPSRDRGKPVSVPCRANRTAAAAAEPSRDRGKPVSVPCRANHTDAPPLPSRAEIGETCERAVPRKPHRRAAAAEPSRDRGKPVNVPCHAPITSIRVNELYCVTLPPLLLYLG